MLPQITVLSLSAPCTSQSFLPKVYFRLRTVLFRFSGTEAIKAVTFILVRQERPAFREEPGPRLCHLVFADNWNYHLFHIVSTRG